MKGMKEFTKNKSKGWEEDTDPTCMNKQGKPIARRHHEVATKNAAKDKLKDTLRSPFAALFKLRDGESGEPEPDREIADEVIEEEQEEHSESAEKAGSKEDVEEEDSVECIRAPTEPTESDIEELDSKKK